MSDEQLNLFPNGKPGRGTAGEKTRPIALVPVDLDANSSLAAAMSAFHGFMIRQGFSDNTVKAFQADLRLLTKYMAANKTLGAIGQSDLEQFLVWMKTDRGVPCSPKSYARRVTTLKVFFAWLADAGVLPTDPAAPVLHERPTTPLPEILYDGQVNDLLRTARDLLWASKPDSRPYLLLTLVLQTGIKKGECMEIKPEHIDLSNPQAPVLYVRYADPRRTLKERKLALGPTFARPTTSTCASINPRNTSSSARPAIWNTCWRIWRCWQGSQEGYRSNNCGGRAPCVTTGTACPPTNYARSSASHS